MKNLKKIGIIILVVLVLLAGLIWFWYYASFQSSLWQKFPEPFRTQMAMTQLEVMDAENLICHEDCMYEKQAYKQMIADYIISHGSDSVMAWGMEQKVLDEEVNFGMRQDSVLVLKMVEDAKKKNDPNYAIKAPQSLAAYLSAAGGNQKIKDLIVAEFGADKSLAFGAVTALMAKIKDTGLGLGERIPAIKNLASLASKKVPGTENSTTTGPIPVLKDVIDYPAICNLLISVAEEKGDERLRYIAISSLFVCTDFKDYYSEDIFNRLQTLLFKEDNHPEIQGSLVYNFKKYYLIDKEKTILAMENIYQDKNLNKFTIDGAAGFLKEKGIVGYPEPIISDEEHNNYAQHMDEVQYYEK